MLGECYETQKIKNFNKKKKKGKEGKDSDVSYFSLFPISNYLFSFL